MNTIATTNYREKWFSTSLQQVLRNALVSEKIFAVDRSGNKVIKNPYGSAATAVVGAISGTYTVDAYTTTDDSLTVTDEVSKGEHIFGFESILSNYDQFASRMDEIMYGVSAAVDKYVLNVITEEATGSFSASSVGGLSAATANDFLAQLISKVAGYEDMYKGLFLVIENTEVPAFLTAQATNGFSFADAALNNGFMRNMMGVDIYVVRTGTFDDQTTSAVSGTKTWTNAGHRLFGVKGVATYAAPQGNVYQEVKVTGKTGMEIGVTALVGAHCWVQKQGLLVDITL